MYNNNISGELPPELGKLSNLQHMQFSSNNVSGSLPQELGSLKNLESL